MERTKETEVSEALAQLRVQLFSAMRQLRGEQLAQFWQLVDEVQRCRPPGTALDVGPHTGPSSRTGARLDDAQGVLHGEREWEAHERHKAEGRVVNEDGRGPHMLPGDLVVQDRLAPRKDEGVQSLTLCVSNVLTAFMAYAVEHPGMVYHVLVTTEAPGVSS